MSLRYKPLSVNILRKVQTACVYILIEKGNVEPTLTVPNNKNGEIITALERKTGPVASSKGRECIGNFSFSLYWSVK